MSTLYQLKNCENETIKNLTNAIIVEQYKCTHEFGDEWQEYNIYKKRCKKCAYTQVDEY